MIPEIVEAVAGIIIRIGKITVVLAVFIALCFFLTLSG